MAGKNAKKENLPTNVDVNLENGGTIKYANEVIATIAGVAANEIEGIAGMTTGGGFADIIGRSRSLTRGVKVDVNGEDASVELYIVVEYGSPIQKVAFDVQENVRKAIETMTGLHVVNVDVHVQGVSFEKEKQALESGLESARLTSDDNPEAPQGNDTDPGQETETVFGTDMEEEADAGEQTADAVDAAPEV